MKKRKNREEEGDAIEAEIEESEESPKGKLKDIGTVLASIRKKHGKSAIQLFNEAPSTNVDVISTGSFLIDNALGIGGLPKGRIIEILGVAGGGKTTVALHVLAEAQKRGEKGAFIDAEHSLDISLAKKVGVQVEDLIFNQPDYGEQGLDIVETLTQSGSVGVIVIDSVSALVPKAELEGEMGDSHMGLQARMMGQALRKINGIASKTNTMIIFINQIRKKIGVMFGSPETTSGGEALKFFSSVRLDIRPVGQIKGKKGDETIVIGNEVQVKILKNKLAVPFQTIRTDLIFGKGFNKEGEILDIASDLEIIDTHGSKRSYRDQDLGKGRFAAIKTLHSNPELFEAIRTEVMSQRGKANGTQEVV